MLGCTQANSSCMACTRVPELGKIQKFSDLNQHDPLMIGLWSEDSQRVLLKADFAESAEMLVKVQSANALRVVVGELQKNMEDDKAALSKYETNLRKRVLKMYKIRKWKEAQIRMQSTEYLSIGDLKDKIRCVINAGFEADLHCRLQSYGCT